MSSGFILVGMQSCPGLFPQLCAMTLTSVKMVTSLQERTPAANFLMLIYLDFRMILDGFCVIQIADELTGGAQRQTVTPKDQRFAEWERSAPHVFPDRLLYHGRAAISRRRDCQHRHHLYCCHDIF